MQPCLFQFYIFCLSDLKVSVCFSVALYKSKIRLKVEHFLIICLTVQFLHHENHRFDQGCVGFYRPCRIGQLCADNVDIVKCIGGAHLV